MKILLQYRIIRKLSSMLVAFILLLGISQINCAMQANSGATQVNTTANESINIEFIYNVLSKALKSAGSLNYFKDTCAVFDFNGNTLTLDWGFAGSGDIFKPLDTITCNFGFAEDKNGTVSATGVIKTLALNHFNKQLRKKANKTDGLKWLANFKFTPIHLLGLKLVLLLKSLETEQDKSHILEEVASLLFRLSLVDDLSIVDKNKPLTAYLPEGLNEVLDETGLGLTEFIDQVWNSIVSNKTIPSNLTLQKPVNIEAFVFSDKNLANNAFEHFKNYEGSDFYQDFESFGNSKDGNFGVVEHSKFKMVNTELSEEDILNGGQINPFAGNLVDYKEFTLDGNASVGSKFEEEAIKQIRQLNGKDGVIKIEDSNKSEYWIARVSSNLGVIGAAKCLILTFTRVFKEYVNAKKSLYEGNDTASLQYRAVVDAREKLRKNLEKFTRSTEGKIVFDSICKRVIALTDNNVSEKARQDLMETKSMLTKAITDLEKLKATMQQSQQRLEMLGVYPTLTEDTEIADLAKQIQDKKLELEAINMQLNSTNNNYANKQDAERLGKLTKLVQEKELLGETINPKIFELINNLKQKIASSQNEYLNRTNFLEKLAVREKVAQVFEQTATELRAKPEAGKNNEETCSDEYEKSILEMLNCESMQSTETFAARLDEAANEIRINNKKAEKLNILRGINQRSTTETQELDILNLEVGHILDSRTHENFIHNLMLRNSIFNEFVSDIINCGNTDIRIMGLKQLITESVQKIVNGSGTIQENLIALKYAMQYVPSAAKALLRISGAEQLVNA